MILPKKFMIPESRIPRAISQVPYDDCVAVTLTKIIEIIEKEKTGVYRNYSVGYMYGRNNDPKKKGTGMDYSYVLPMLRERGTVPEEMCPIIDEYPAIRKKLAALPNIKELDKEAEKTRIAGWCKMPGTAKFKETLRGYLYDYQMPMVGDVAGKSHCVVVVGWDGDEFIYQEHDEKGTLKTGDLNEAYYISGYLENKVKPEPVELPEPTTIHEILAVLVSAGIVTNVDLWSRVCDTDVNTYWLCRKMAKFVIEKGVK